MWTLLPGLVTLESLSSVQNVFVVLRLKGSTCELALYATWTLGCDGFGAFYCRTTEVTIINTSDDVVMVSVTQTFV